MKRFSVYFVIISMLLLFIRCEKEKTQNPDNHSLKLAETLPGGCNTENDDNLKSLSFNKDTIAFTLENDTLDVYVGLNYICCAPFNSETILSNDSIFITLNDVCGQTDQPCYCHCMCYYTWDFLFTELEEKEYYFKVILNDPRQDEPIIIEEVTIEIAQTN